MKIKHLKKAEEFRGVSRRGKKCRGTTVTLIAESRDDVGGDLEVGVVTPKKAAPKAVTRNYVKRVVYGFFRQRKDEYSPGTRVVVSLSRNIGKDTKKSLSALVQQELAELSKKAGLTE